MGIPYPPGTPPMSARIYRDTSSVAGLASYAHRIGGTSMEQHYHLTTVAPDGTHYETCGFWEDEGQARDAISDAYPGHVVAAIEQSDYCTA